MAGEGELDLEVEFPQSLADILDKTEIIFENFDSKVKEAHAEVLDQTISLLREMRHYYNRDTRDTENLDSIAAAFVDVLQRSVTLVNVGRARPRKIASIFEVLD